ncbi:MAG: L-threonylcarbamoyladenylate synthase [Bacteroidota bacterium]
MINTIIDTDLHRAQQLLEAGKLVAIPTETVYGLAGNAYDETAVLKIFQVKQRPSFDPLIVHAGSLQQIQKSVKYMSPQALQLAERFWPGPLTLLLEKKPNIPDLVTSGLPTVGVRIPKHPSTLQLLRQLDFPLAAPSANPFGYISPTTPQHVQGQLGGKVPYILAGGPCNIGVESTIVGFEADRPVVYRLGGVSLEAIEHAIGPVKVAHQHLPQAPGMLDSHYAPRKPLIVGALSTFITQYENQQVGLLTFQHRHPAIASDHQIILSPTGSLDEAAQNLFAALRTLDTWPLDVILAAPVPDTGIGRAINDRLKKASSRWAV